MHYDPSGDLGPLPVYLVDPFYFLPDKFMWFSVKGCGHFLIYIHANNNGSPWINSYLFALEEGGVSSINRYGAISVKEQRAGFKLTSNISECFLP